MNLRRHPTASAAALLFAPHQTPITPPITGEAQAVIDFYRARRMQLDGQTSYREEMTTLALRMQWMADRTDTADSLDLLANLGWQIGLAAEVAYQLDPQGAQVRRLHGALRAVHAMCMQGYAWRAQYGATLDAASAEAGALIQAHHKLAMRLMPGAAELAERIRSRTVKANEIAGAEIYNTRTEEAT